MVTDRLNVGAQIGTPTIRMRSHFFLIWGRIAFRHVTTAREAAEEAERIGPQGEGFGSALERELDEALVAICAASFAFDALYGELKPMVVPKALETEWNRERRGRSYRVFDTLDRALDLGGDARRWSNEIRELFDLRNSAVHFVGEFQIQSCTPQGLMSRPRWGHTPRIKRAGSLTSWWKCSAPRHLDRKLLPPSGRAIWLAAFHHTRQDGISGCDTSEDPAPAAAAGHSLSTSGLESGCGPWTGAA